MYAGKFEFFVFKWVVIEKFRDYLYYFIFFIVYIDNNLFIYILSLFKLFVVGYRWVVELVDFNFNIKYRFGKFNIDVDVLFRLLLDFSEYMEDCIVEMEKDIICVII